MQLGSLCPKKIALKALKAPWVTGLPVAFGFRTRSLVLSLDMGRVAVGVVAPSCQNYSIKEAPGRTLLLTQTRDGIPGKNSHPLPLPAAYSLGSPGHPAYKQGYCRELRVPAREKRSGARANRAAEARRRWHRIPGFTVVWFLGGVERLSWKRIFLVTTVVLYECSRK
jgi:hypothetical protein